MAPLGLLIMPIVSASIASTACCYVGVYVVLRRIVFVSAALAQLGAAGVGLGLMLNINPVVTCYAFILLGMLFVPLIQRERRVSRESVLGAMYAIAASLAMIFVAKSPAEEHLMESTLFGELLYATKDVALRLGIVTIITLAIHLVLFKPLLLSSFDPEFATTLGIRTQLFDSVFYIALAILIGECIRAVGALLTFSYLVLPPVTALLLTDRLKIAFVISISCGLVANIAGVIISFHYDLPSSPTVAACTLLPLVAIAPLAICLRLSKARHHIKSIQQPKKQT
ncbi:MAG: metal ABC transporter permease [Armatimonadota bacterium]|nr:metal ABC transporter permease [Armatimonadota bacterium]MCX7778143.1 metal ABC transporter permease [Armatimonadota bacterium]MDW8024497.1 metal ABC transporter permease [Armatimonadota bacterium]